jgi:hypothetical protein
LVLVARQQNGLDLTSRSSYTKIYVIEFSKFYLPNFHSPLEHEMKGRVEKKAALCLLEFLAFCWLPA